jgi:hypothetical protein
MLDADVSLKFSIIVESTKCYIFAFEIKFCGKFEHSEHLDHFHKNTVVKVNEIPLKRYNF